MKKTISLILAVLFIAALVSCANAPENQSTNTDNNANTKNSDTAQSKDIIALTEDMMWQAIDADEYDNKTEYSDSFGMTQDEFRKELLTRYPAPNHRPFLTDENSRDEEYLIKAGTVSVYTNDNAICIALVITQDTHDLNEMKVVVFKSGADSKFGVYKAGWLISDFGKSEKGAENCDSAIYVRENNGQLLLFVESAKGYRNSGTNYSYELRTYIINNNRLNFCSDLKYSGTEGSRLTSRSLPMGYSSEQYTKYSGEYVLYCDAFSSGTTDYSELHNGFANISDAVTEYFKSFGISRNKLTYKADSCRLKYGTGIEKIADFAFHSGTGSASIALSDYTGLHR